MRFYTKQHQFYCGIDLHARSMNACILNQGGEILVHRNMKAHPESFLQVIAPYRDDLVVAVECMFTWYWLADLCARAGLAFVLGRALYMELSVLKIAKQHDANTLYLLHTIPGIGEILSLVLLYEIHAFQRFPRAQDFVSYCRLVKCSKESAGKRYGTSGTKMGNAYLKWALSEAAVLFLRAHPAGQK
jgi:hypothetical protein